MTINRTFALASAVIIVLYTRTWSSAIFGGHRYYTIGMYDGRGRLYCGTDVY